MIRRPDAEGRDGPGSRERIRRYLLECQLQGESPTVREIGDSVGLSSPATVQQHLRILERQGVLQQIGGGRSRCWRINELPKGRTPRIPVVGRIAVGEPFENPDRDAVYLPISPRAFAPSGEVVALRVDGESMVEAGILSGDHVIIQRQGRVESGDVAAVLINGEGSLKRWRQKNQRVALEPSNRLFSPVPLHRRGGDISIYGKLVGVVRSFS